MNQPADPNNESHLSDPIWYVAIGGKRQGPMTLEEAGALVTTDRLTPETLVWRRGMLKWTHAGQVEELAPWLNPAPLEGEPPLEDEPPPLDAVADLSTIPALQSAVLEDSPLHIERDTPPAAEEPSLQQPYSEPANWSHPAPAAAPLLRGLRQEPREDELAASLSMFWIGAGLALLLVLGTGAYFFWVKPSDRNFIVDNGPLASAETTALTPASTPIAWPTSTPWPTMASTPTPTTEPSLKPAPKLEPTAWPTATAENSSIAAPSPTPWLTARPLQTPAWKASPTPLPEAENWPGIEKRSETTTASVRGEDLSTELPPDTSPAAEIRAKAARNAAELAKSRYTNRQPETDPMQDALFKAAEQQFKFARSLERQGRFDRAEFYYREAQRLFKRALDAL